MENKNLNGITGMIAAVGTVATVVTPLIEKAIDKAGKQSDEKVVEKVKVPELYHKGFPIDLEQAVKLLDDCGLKCSKSKMTVKEANPKYKDCFNLQVIDSNPKQGAMVKIGSTVCLKCISEEVVVESQKLFDEIERSRAEAKEKKEAERLERKERAKENVSEAMNKTRRGVEKIIQTKSKKRI